MKMMCSSASRLLVIALLSTFAVNALGTDDNSFSASTTSTTTAAAVAAATEATILASDTDATLTDKDTAAAVAIAIDQAAPAANVVSDNVAEIVASLAAVQTLNDTLNGAKRKRCINCSYRRVYYTYPDGRVVERYINAARSYEPAQGGCSPGVCGSGASCREVSGRPVCSCPPGYEGNPLTHCSRPECLDHIECPGSLACKNGHCVNPCTSACGVGALCEPRNHVAVCSCPRNFEGDPYHQCRPSDPEQQCHPSPCGANTKCEIIGSVPTCSCLHGFQGNPLTGCRHECEYDGECGPQEMCKDFKCVKSCNACGTLANCVSVSNHRAVCECPKGYIGSPYTECRPECYGDVDCPSNRPACFYGICKNTCDGACGVGADCNLRGLTPVCSCPRDMTGDPFIRCRPFTKDDLCEPNPCGTNAFCVPGHDNTGKERPVCNCAPGYTGNPLTHCVRGECQSNEECADSQACINYQCVNPCIGKCGSGATCEPKAHLAVCKCPPGTGGDALVSCRKSRTIPVAKYH